MKILVLSKERMDAYGNPIGLQNSANFISLALTGEGHFVTPLCLVDANSIDAAVAEFQPELVLVEALWVTPAKLGELRKLHPGVRWVVRIHSNVPFLAMEGIAINWVRECATMPGVLVVANNALTSRELSGVLGVRIGYLPNVYLSPDYCPRTAPRHEDNDDVLNISCFGAVRPFKNHLVQGLAAIWAAKILRKTLHFHVNATRTEQNGSPILHNLQAAFADTANQLVLHDWQSHRDFLNTVAYMDLGAQVSFTESFNIVAADHVHVGVPVVVSPEIRWLAGGRMASPTDMEGITEAMVDALQHRRHDVRQNTGRLMVYNAEAKRAWHSFLANIG